MSKRKTADGGTWTLHEVEILREYYPDMTDERLKSEMLPDRSLNQIRTKARSLRLGKNRPLRSQDTAAPVENHDSPNQIPGPMDLSGPAASARLRQFYGHVSGKCLSAMFPGHARQALRPAAMSVGGLACYRDRNDAFHVNRVHRTTAVVTGLSCAACQDVISPGDKILICPECAAVFCERHAQDAHDHFTRHRTDAPSEERTDTCH